MNSSAPSGHLDDQGGSELPALRENQNYVLSSTHLACRVVIDLSSSVGEIRSASFPEDLELEEAVDAPGDEQMIGGIHSRAGSAVTA